MRIYVFRYHRDDNAFKEEDYTSYSMKPHENDLSDDEKNRYYIKYIKYMLEKNIIEEHRGSCGFYMSTRIYEDWKYFCDNHPEKSYKFIESALLAFMMAYPEKMALIEMDFTVKENNNTQQQLQDSLLCNNLKSWMDKVLIHTQSGTLDDYPQCWEKFTEYSDAASKFTNPSPRLEKLMKEAMQLI